jgi:serine protease Do
MNPMHLRRSVAGLLVLAGTLAGQNRRQEPLISAEPMKRAFTAVVEAANRATARIACGDKIVAFATVVGEGLLVTKASELSGESLCCEMDGHRLPCSRIGLDDSDDLALLQAQGESEPGARPVRWQPVAWRDELPQPGAFLASTSGAGLPAGIGILSAPLYRHSQQRGFLGVQMTRQQQPVTLQTVTEDSAAAAAGLLAGDVILALGGEPVDTSAEFMRRLGLSKPGDKVSLHVRRDERELDLEATLRTDRRGPLSSQERLWGPLSEVRSGFGDVLQHDTVLRPDQCGGPLVDLSGKAVGINIARAGRVETLALPSSTVRKAVARMLAEQAKPKR